VGPAKVQERPELHTTTLVLIRHAEAVEHDCQGNMRLCGWLDVPLTELGRLQAEHLRLVAPQLGAVAGLFTSSLKRAADTARPLADALGLRSRARRELREISCGWLEGLPVSEVRACYPEVWQANMAQTDETFRWPGGESYRGFRARVLRSMRRLAVLYEKSTVVIVTHAGVITQVLGALAGESAARWDVFRPDNASLTVVRWAGDGGVVIRFNDRRHLETLSSPHAVGTTNDAQVLAQRRDSSESLGWRAAEGIQRDS
jgi:broad specificity phosphatase PhoE